MWDFSPVESMTGPIVGFLAACLVIIATITVAWLVIDNLRNQK